jgi:transcriptional regulator with PAS, ATPase and Fis domain
VTQESITPNAWVSSFPGAVTVCDAEGIILEMNQKSAEMFEKDGGLKLIGSNLLDCHPEPARVKLEQIMAEQLANIYTIEKNGAKKLIYQTPWYESGQYRGFVEIVLTLPAEMPHFIRAS